jgi:sRNA-binding carbon storage regulator CsrA
MHIIPAKKGEVVYIGNVRLSVGRLRRDGAIEIGVEAPREIPIRREEYRENLSSNKAYEVIVRQVFDVKKGNKQRLLLEVNVDS